MSNNLLTDVIKRSVKFWWISVLVGIIAVGLGVLFLTTPQGALLSFALLFAIGFVINGTFELIFAISNRKELSGWGWNLVGAIVDLILGILLLSLPGLTIFILIYFVAFWILFRSIWSIGASLELQKIGLKGWGWLLAFAILGVLFSFAFILSPAFGGSFIVAFASIGFMMYGIFRIALGIRQRSFKNEIEGFEKKKDQIEI